MSFSKKSLAVIYGLAISKSLLEGFAIFQNTFRHPSFFTIHQLLNVQLILRRSAARCLSRLLVIFNMAKF